MTTVDLPEDGDLTVAGEVLPPGRRHFAEWNQQLVAWVTDRPVAGAGRTWLALSAARVQTGLFPVLLVQAGWIGEPKAGNPPEFGFYSPAAAGLMAQMSAETILADAWNDADDDPYLAAERAPFGAQFPGLAAAETSSLPRTQLEQAVSQLPPAYLGLVPARRPADIPAAVGWSVFGTSGAGRAASADA